MGELYLRGTKSETIVAEAVCVGASPIPDAVVIPEALDGLLVERLAELPDEPSINSRLFVFLYQRASDRVFTKFIAQHGQTLGRNAYGSEHLSYDPTVLVRARAHTLALLQPELREESAARLEYALLNEADTSFLEEEEILGLVPPTKLLRLASQMRARLLTRLPTMANDIAEDPELDLDQEPAENFENLQTALRALESFFESDDSAVDLLSDAEAGIEEAIHSVEEKKQEKKKREAREEEDSWHWEDREPAQSMPATHSHDVPLPRGVRSIFSDVDQ